MGQLRPKCFARVRVLTCLLRPPDAPGHVKQNLAIRLQAAVVSALSYELR